MKKVFLVAVLLVAIAVMPVQAKKEVIAPEEFNSKKIALLVRVELGSCYVWSMGKGVALSTIPVPGVGMAVFINDSKKKGQSFQELMGNFSLEKVFADSILNIAPTKFEGSQWNFIPSRDIPFLKNAETGEPTKNIDFKKIAADGSFDFIVSLEAVEWGLRNDKPYIIVFGKFYRAATDQTSKRFDFWGSADQFDLPARPMDDWGAEAGKLYGDAIAKYSGLLASNLSTLMQGHSVKGASTGLGMMH